MVKEGEDGDVQGVHLWSTRVMMRMLMVFAIVRDGSDEDVEGVKLWSRRVKMGM